METAPYQPSKSALRLLLRVNSVAPTHRRCSLRTATANGAAPELEQIRYAERALRAEVFGRFGQLHAALVAPHLPIHCGPGDDI